MGIDRLAAPRSALTETYRLAARNLKVLDAFLDAAERLVKTLASPDILPGRGRRR